MTRGAAKDMDNMPTSLLRLLRAICVVVWHGHLAREEGTKRLIFAWSCSWARCPCHTMEPQRKWLYFSTPLSICAVYMYCMAWLAGMCGPDPIVAFWIVEEH